MVTGLCHTCYHSNVETIFDEHMKPICKNCAEKKAMEDKK